MKSSHTLSTRETSTVKAIQFAPSFHSSLLIGNPHFHEEQFDNCSVVLWKPKRNAETLNFAKRIFVLTSIIDRMMNERLKKRVVFIAEVSNYFL
jgi:hypothetical protein